MRRLLLCTTIACTIVSAACASGEERTDATGSPAASAATGSFPSPADGPGAAGAPAPGTCGPVPYDFPRELYPFEDRCIDLGFGDYHFVDESPEGTPKGTVVMVHGNPTSSFLYRDVARDLLARGYRVVAADHYGFGLSAKPSDAEFGYRPSDHAAVLTEFVDALDLRDVTLLVQDWGGPIGLGMAVQRPDRIGSVLIMNTWAWQVTEADVNGPYGALTRWSQGNHEPLGRQLAESGMTVTGAAATLAAPYPEPPQQAILHAYQDPFFDSATGEVRPGATAPTLQLALDILDDIELFDLLGSLEPIADKPVVLYFGGADPLFGALTPNPDGSCAEGAVREGTPGCSDPDGRPIYPFIERFTELWNADAVRGVEINDEAGHFVQDQAPARVAELVEELRG